MSTVTCPELHVNNYTSKVPTETCHEWCVGILQQFTQVSSVLSTIVHATFVQVKFVQVAKNDMSKVTCPELHVKSDMSTVTSQDCHMRTESCHEW